MNFFKKIISLTLCLVLCAVLSVTAFAATTPQITISDERALSGEEVTVNITMTQNPGIMSMTFSVKYDKNNFEFVDCAKGFTNTPYYKDHTEKGYIIFSISETSNNISSGNLLSLTFRVKNTATPGKYPITLANQDPEKNGDKLDNCFANQKEDYIVPNVKAGSITVSCTEAGHSYSEWNTVTGATCTKKGEKNRICSNCGDVETEAIPMADHNFEADWTVDKIATPEENGIMSRHCVNCDAVTDKISFSYEEIGGGDDEESTSSDQSSTESTSSDTSSEQSSSSQDSSSSSGSNSKPNINNTVGGKNPQSEVEKLEKYPEINNDDEQNTSSEQNSSEQNSTPTDNNSSDDVTTGTDADEDKPSFLSTPTGIIVLVICILLSLGILAFGIILILRNEKSQ